MKIKSITYEKNGCEYSVESASGSCIFSKGVGNNKTLADLTLFITERTNGYVFLIKNGSNHHHLSMVYKSRKEFEEKYDPKDMDSENWHIVEEIDIADALYSSHDLIERDW